MSASSFPKVLVSAHPDIKKGVFHKVCFQLPKMALQVYKRPKCIEILSANLRELDQVKINRALEPLTTCNPSLGENTSLVLQLSFSVQNKSVK